MNEVDQHLAFLRAYLKEMSPDNWRDLKLRCERQIDELEKALSFWVPDRADHGGPHS